MQSLNKKRGRQYVGITGVKTPQQVAALQTVWDKQAGKKRVRPLFAPGVMTRNATLNGLPSKFTDSDPQPKKFSSILNGLRTFNVLHYADSGMGTEFDRTLQELVRLGGLRMDAVQLDMDWPDAERLANAIYAARVVGRLEIILQISSRALAAAKNDVRNVLHRIDDYVRENCVHRVLLDCSMGRGKPLDSTVLLPLARAIRERHPGMGLVFAGGLCADTIDLLDPILAEFPDASFDAEGKMRASGDACDPIDMGLCEAFLIAAAAKVL